MPWKHPELRKGEVWLSNFYEGEELEEGDDLSEFCDIAWKTKRRGCRAYDINGQRLYCKKSKCNSAFLNLLSVTMLLDTSLRPNKSN